MRRSMLCCTAEQKAKLSYAGLSSRLALRWLAAISDMIFAMLPRDGRPDAVAAFLFKCF